MQTTLQRCPRNSVEQFGQIEETSFRLAGTGLAGARFAGTPAAVSTALGAVVKPEELLVELRVEFSVGLISGVVAQIQSPENSNISDTREAEPYSYLNASAGKIRDADHDG